MTSLLPEQTETLRQLSAHWEVAITPAVVVLKMVAFLDRPEREDDLTDIAQVVERLRRSRKVTRVCSPE